jgi:hypothetical protein
MTEEEIQTLKDCLFNAFLAIVLLVLCKVANVSVLSCFVTMFILGPIFRNNKDD